jgi:hypothetical protein
MEKRIYLFFNCKFKTYVFHLFVIYVCVLRNGKTKKKKKITVRSHILFSNMVIISSCAQSLFYFSCHIYTMYITYLQVVHVMAYCWVVFCLLSFSEIRKATDVFGTNQTGAFIRFINKSSTYFRSFFHNYDIYLFVAEFMFQEDLCCNQTTWTCPDNQKSRAHFSRVFFKMTGGSPNPPVNILMRILGNYSLINY